MTEPSGREESDPTSAPAADEPDAGPDQGSADHDGVSADGSVAHPDGEESFLPGSRDASTDAEPAVRSRKGMLIVGGAGLALLLLALCCGAGVLFAVQRFRNSPTEVVESYLDATRDGDTAERDDLTCERKRDRGVSDLDPGSEAESREFFKGLTWKIDRDRKVSDSRHEVTVTLEFAMGAETPTTIEQTFEVVDEDGWKVCEIAD